MLSAIREHSKGWIAWVIVGLMGLPLVVTGLYSYFSGSSASAEVAIVNGTKISPDILNNAYQRERQRLQEMFGGRLDPSLFDEKAMRREVLDRLVNETLVTDYVQQQGFRIADATLASMIHGQQVFQENGKFSAELYNVLLRNNGYTPQAYEAQVRVSEAVSQFQGGVFGSAFATPLEVQQLQRLQNQERDVAYLSVSAESFKPQVNLTDEDVQAYYQANTERYQRPEQVQLAYLELSPEQLAAQAPIDEAALEARYKELKSTRFTQGGRRQASHILLSVPEGASAEQLAQAEAKLNQLRERIQKGEITFEAAAKEYSEDPGSAEKGGDLGWVDRGAMVEAFETATYALDEGQLSQPVRSPFGLHLIQVTDVEPVTVQSFADVRDDLQRELAEDGLKRQMATLGARLADLTYEHPDELDAAASELGLEVKRTDWISAVAGGQGIAANPRVREAAFGDEVLRERRNSDVIELENGRMVVVRVAEHQPAAPLPIAEVADQIKQTLRQEKAAAMAREAAETLEAKISDGAAPADLAKDARGVKLADAGFIKRVEEQVPAQVVRKAFELPKPDGGTTVGTVGLPSGDYAVVQLRAVRDGEASGEKAPSAENLQTRLARVNGNTMVRDLVTALRQQADVKIYEDRL